ncbi:MAG: hypothetical protein J4F30_09955, partial [Acidobacteria bacterium]|nr:hypothetical protein [Acidobacteriota bacterium]
LLVPVQGAAQPVESAEIPRTPWGRPVLQGVWTNSSLTPLERPEEYGEREFLTAEELVELQRGAVQGRIDALPEPEATLAVEFSEIWMEPGPLSGRTSLVTGPTGKIPAYTDAALARLADGLRQPLTQRADSHDDRGYSERCLRFVTGGPPMMAFPFAPLLQIFQTPDHVVIQNEENHEIRVIPLEDRPHVDPRIRLWRGDSRGRWEGDTLVVETTNFHGKGGFRGSGPELHLTEKLTRIDADTVLYEFTADDPGTWTEPWTAEMPLKVSPAPIYEHACHEGNYTLPLVLNGARVQERE